MSQRKYINLAIVVAIILAAVWVNLPSSSIKIGSFQRDLKTRLGLDLRGGLQVLLEAKESNVTADQLDIARQILESRANDLGVEEVTFQTAGENRIVGEFPGATNIDQVLSAINVQGFLEFVQSDNTYIAPGTVIQTDYGTGADANQTPAATTDTLTPTAESTASPTAEPTASGTATPEATATATDGTATTVYHTVMTGTAIKSVAVTKNTLGEYVVTFELTDEGSKIFSDFTTAHVGEYLAIVLDKKVISDPTINTAITKGSGEIQGQFTYESANALAVQLRYGSLPVSLQIIESKVIGPTLGEDSLQKSLLAGGVGLLIIILFMAIYYRLPGFVADFSIIFYALLTLAIFKLIPVTLTLPGIAGLMLSTGSALDANILIFERLKEELRTGKTLLQALPLAWHRAWPSIRDSNIATLITSVILFWFGSSFGASIVKGFAITLALGVLVSLFTALFVTRTLLTNLLDVVKPTNLAKWFGI